MLKSIEVTQQLLAKIGAVPMTQLKTDLHNHEYEAMVFSVNEIHFRSRLAKKTPNKKGFFVTCWEKDDSGRNQPFPYEQSPDKLIVSIIDEENKGQFIFPKSVLLKQSILRDQETKGKMAFRIYPVWESNLNKTAQKTQLWQRDYFLDLTKSVDKDRASHLYFSKD